MNQTLGAATSVRPRPYSLLKNSQHLAVLKGHGFIRAGNGAETSSALAAEGWFAISSIRHDFSRAATQPVRSGGLQPLIPPIRRGSRRPFTPCEEAVIAIPADTYMPVESQRVRSSGEASATCINSWEGLACLFPSTFSVECARPFSRAVTQINSRFIHHPKSAHLRKNLFPAAGV
jgi:hypothetical protein